MGALLGVGAGAMLLPLAFVREFGAVRPAGAMIALGIVGGLGASLRNRPTLAQIAMEIDRQLGLADVLSTALTMKTCGIGAATVPDEAFARAVIADADARLRGVSPSLLVLNRLGARAWGGIGLAMALVLTVAALLSPPAGQTPVLASSDASASRSMDRPPAGVCVVPRPLGGRGQEASRGLEARPAPLIPTDGPADPVAGERSPGEGSDAPGSDRGAGSARTDDAQTIDGGRRSSATPHRIAESQRDGEPASLGSGRASAAGDRGAPAVDGTVAREPSRGHELPWRSASWANDRAAAHRAVETGAVPASYRDLVRDYFDR
jgi:hypothetical protein